MAPSRQLLLASALMVLAVGCGSQESTDGSDLKNLPPKAADSTEYIVDFLHKGMNRLVSDSDLAVQGTVVAISAPRWNQIDGSEWSHTPPSADATYDPNVYITVPMQYRDVT